MTKGEFIGAALLKLNEGEINPSNRVWYSDIVPYLAAAVNYVQVGNYWLESKGEGERTINPLLLTTFDNVAIQYSEDHERYYSDLPKNVITLPKGRALEITTMCGKKCWPLGQGDDALEQYYGRFKKNISYQLEGQKRVWYYNLPKLIKAVRPKYIVHINDLDDTDEIILPSDGDVKVLDLIIKMAQVTPQENIDYTSDANIQ